MNDYKYVALRAKGYNSSVIDMFMQHIRIVTSNLGAVERDYWLTIAPTATGSANDVKYAALLSLGYTGSISDMETAYWKNVVL